MLQNSIKKAKLRIILHSTFIDAQKFELIEPLLVDAAKRGVLIDILWGENDDKVGEKTTRAIVRKIREKFLSDGLDSILRVHSFSTRSHGKFFIADNGQSENLFAVVGSCNWLCSDFRSFEVSVRLRDPRLVSQLLEQCAQLTCASDGNWTSLTNELAKLASHVQHHRIPSGGRASVSLILGPQHVTFVRKARDEAKSRLFVTSHRFGSATRPTVIIPAVTAVRDRGIDVQVFYGRISGHVSNTEAAKVTRNAADEGIKIHIVSEPRLHAKLLAWDDDNVLITSQNWLSADPSEANFLREIGIFISSKSVARHVIENFNVMRQP